MTTWKPGKAMGEDEFAAALASYLDALLENYMISGKGRELAAYISSGGEIDAWTRPAIVRCLRGSKTTVRRKKTAAKDKTDIVRDIDFYNRVKMDVAASLLAMAFNPTAIGGAKPTQKQAYKLIGPGFNVGVRGAKAMYARGRKAFNEIYISIDKTATDGSANAGSSTPSRSLHNLLTEYEVGKDPAILAEYVEHGGEISDAVKAIIIRELRGEEDDNRPDGHSDPYDDLEFYLNVERRREQGDKLVTALVSVGHEYGLERTGAKDKYKRGKLACRLGSMRDGSE
jgi:hypothetical protein